jgi:hypothetical protein
MKIPPRFSSQDAMVLSSGLLTGLAVLGGLLWLGERAPDFNPMGRYVLFIIPFGAVLVGIVAGLGYGLASFWSGRRITRPLMVVILLLQAVVYVLAHWVDFHRNDLVFEDGTKVGSMEYFDCTGCRAGLLTSEFRVPEQPAKVLAQEVIAPEVVPVLDELR